MQPELFFGILSVLGVLTALIFRIGMWYQKQDSLGSAFKTAKRNGNGDSIAYLIERIAGIEATTKDTNNQVAELSKQLAIQQAERTLINTENARQHDEFRSHIAAITRRIDSLQGSP